MEGGSAKLNIDHLVHLGFHTNIQSRRWQDLFKKNTVSRCMGCGNKIRVTDPISKTLNLRYFSHRHIPEVHWIFDFQLNPEDPEAITQCKAYVNTLSNKQKKGHMFPCCYKCWNIAVYINKNYNTTGVEQYNTQFQTAHPEYTNWNVITLEQCQTEEQRNAKIMQYYEYIRDWCSVVNVCCHTENGLKYCSKAVGKCIHTNPNWVEPVKPVTQKQQPSKLRSTQSVNSLFTHNPTILHNINSGASNCDGICSNGKIDLT